MNSASQVCGVNFILQFVNNNGNSAPMWQNIYWEVRKYARRNEGIKRFDFAG